VVQGGGGIDDWFGEEYGPTQGENSDDRLMRDNKVSGGRRKGRAGTSIRKL